MPAPFFDFITLDKSRLSPDDYSLTIPAIAALERLDLHPQVTYFIGENGSGKSTLLEGIAVADGFNPEGGSRNFQFSTKDTHSRLCQAITIARGPNPVRNSDGWFLRAESFYNVATDIEELAKQPGGDRFLMRNFGGKLPHIQSHGESFFSLFLNRFRGNGVYILDEPESALSPKRQLSFLTRMHDLIQAGSQFIIATHSPILMAYPEAMIYQFSGEGIEQVAYEDTDHYQITQMFLMRRESMLRELLRDDDTNDECAEGV
ncbi:MAG: AAA family ATPase [Planctomycetales bacterium 12-60-4]|nr:MAG: AAA family ATPase [Planctomycetales bacterium 12-60-4]